MPYAFELVYLLYPMLVLTEALDPSNDSYVSPGNILLEQKLACRYRLQAWISPYDFFSIHFLKYYVMFCMALKDCF